MALVRTRRRLDTCDCRVVYEWDNSIPSNQVIHTVVAYENKCSFHQSVPGVTNNQDLYDNVVCNENAKKNDTIGLLLENGPNTIYDINSDGTRVFKKGVSVSWSWTGNAPNRLLTIILFGVSLTTNQRNAVQAKLDERYGISNVTIING